MSMVEQIHHLESRVDRLLAALREFRSDNDSLRVELAATEQRAGDLERRLAESDTARQEADRRGAELQQRLSGLLAEHEEIEATINRTLAQLSKLDIGAAGEPGGTADTDAAPAGEIAAVIADDHESDADTAPMHVEEPPAADESAADEPEADADNKEGDDLDIF